jgi:hydrogenase/urease accessory protein HupE
MLGRNLIVFCIVFIAWVFAAPANAHEVRPAYLELREISPGEFDVLWKTPMRGDQRLALAPEFSGSVEIASPIEMRVVPGAAIQTWTLRASTLRGQVLTIRGLENTLTDTLARIEFGDRTQWTTRLTARSPAALVPEQDTAMTVSRVYLVLGVEHILFGIDHLLFVLLLVLVAAGTWPLIKTITAFTLAHSVTLTLAALGFVTIPQPPVEAVISLSIVFVAGEVARRYQGREGITARAPWIVAFTFGLLHGLGFAGALNEIGLPPGQIPLALLFFNLGVEAGQLLFVGAVALLLMIVKTANVRWPRWAVSAPAYGIGSIAVFWLFERVAAF